MKKTMLILVGILSVTQVMAATTYRPYATCFSPNNHTNIEIMQNTDSKATFNPYQLAIDRMIRGNKIVLKDQNALKVMIHRKDVLELFQSFRNKSAYGFDLMVTTKSPVNMAGQYKAYFTDPFGSSVLYCSYHITFE